MKPSTGIRSQPPCRHAADAAACSKIGLYRIRTDSEINAVVKLERLGLTDDRYIDFWKAAQMDDLLREFPTETSGSLDTAEQQLVRFERDPNHAHIETEHLQPEHSD